MNALILSFPSFSIVIPTWVFVILPMLAGIFAMWRSGVNEAVGIAKVSSGDFNTQDHPNINFCRMGFWRVMAYVAMMLFLWMAIQVAVSKPAAVSQGKPFFEMKHEFTTEYDLPGGKVEFVYWAHERCDEELAASVAPASDYYTIFDNSEGRRMSLSRKLWAHLRHELPGEVSLAQMHFYPDDTANAITSNFIGDNG
jgi:hypothetical protein